jgi:hypothetical protein
MTALKLLKELERKSQSRSSKQKGDKGKAATRGVTSKATEGRGLIPLSLW